MQGLLLSRYHGNQLKFLITDSIFSEAHIVYSECTKFQKKIFSQSKIICHNIQIFNLKLQKKNLQKWSHSKFSFYIENQAS